MKTLILLRGFRMADTTGSHSTGSSKRVRNSSSVDLTIRTNSTMSTDIVMLHIISAPANLGGAHMGNPSGNLHATRGRASGLRRLE
jgi:hypothetical protein